MLATDGHFTFVASKPQLACAAFVIAEPSEVISLELYDVNIDCSAGDFIKVWFQSAAASNPHGPLNSERRFNRPSFHFILLFFFFFLFFGRGIKTVSDKVKAALRGRTLGAALVTLLGARVGRAAFLVEEPSLPFGMHLFIPSGLKCQNGKNPNNYVCFPCVGCDLLSRVLSLIRGRKHLFLFGMDEICGIFIEHVGLWNFN